MMRREPGLMSQRHERGIHAEKGPLPVRLAG
jgi:hypothetical protein